MVDEAEWLKGQRAWRAMMGMQAHFVRDLQGFERAAIMLDDIPCQQAATQRDLQEAEQQTRTWGWGLIPAET